MNKPVTQLVRYDAMCTAIAKAIKVDEVKNIRDKAMALALYAKQANNHEAEHQAQNIRVRAERRAGALLASMPKAKGAAEPGTNRGTTRSNNATASTLSSFGVTKQQASEWQRLAKVPEDEFEKAMADRSGTPSGRRLVNIGLHNAWVAESEKSREQGELAPSSPYHVRQFAKAMAMENEREWTIEQACFIAFGRSDTGKKLIARVAEVIDGSAGSGLLACGKTNSMVAALSPWIEINWKNLPIPSKDELEKMFGIEAKLRKKG